MQQQMKQYRKQCCEFQLTIAGMVSGHAMLCAVQYRPPVEPTAQTPTSSTVSYVPEAASQAVFHDACTTTRLQRPIAAGLL